MIPKRVVFLGRDGCFSRTVLRALQGAPVELAGLLVPRSVPGVPLPRRLARVRPLARSEGESLLALGWEQGIPIHEVDVKSASCLALIERLRPDVACVACFPWRLPVSWLRQARRGFLNVHPSLLPAYRGPAPLFWQLRAGETRTGVTVHLMDEGLDTGPVVAQQGVAYPDGASTRELDRLLAQAGGALLANALSASEIEAHPQPPDDSNPPFPKRPTSNEPRASSQPWPSESDRVLPSEWTARRAFNFVRGARDFGPFWVDVGGERVSVQSAVGLEIGSRPTERASEEAGRVRVAFSDGLVELETHR